MDRPSANMQLKGTNICLDVYCVCGESTHVDGEFAHYVLCSKCQRLFEVSQDIKLVELTGEAKYKVIAEDSCIVEAR